MSDLTEEQKKDFKFQTNGKYILEFFPNEYIELQSELNNGLHPKLIAILAPLGPDAIDMRLAHIASYCGVMLDGEYDLKARMHLCTILTKKLVEKREVPPGTIISA